MTDAAQQASLGVFVYGNATNMSGAASTIHNLTSNLTSASLHLSCLEVNRCKFFRTAEYSICLILATAGLLGNIISAIVLSKQHPRSSNVLLLQILSIVDALIMTIFIIISVISLLILNGSYHWGATFPATVALLFDVLHFSSNWLLVHLAVDRFIAVCYPYSASTWCTRSRSYKVFGVIVIGSIALTMPRAVVFYRDGNFNTLDKAYLIISTLFRYVLQIVILSVLNWRLVIATQKATRRESELLSMSSRPSNRCSISSRRHFNSITTNLVAVVLIFLVCGTCRGVYFIIKMGFQNILEPLERTHSWIYLLFDGITNIMMVFNSAVNFLVYCMFYRRFRLTVKHMLYMQCAQQFHKVGNEETDNYSK